jgi:5-(aminomethyl)-3-furanmethanol phosphate kinase
MGITVIKIGGSLMGTDELTSWITNIVKASHHSNIVIVPGGGQFADSIRDLQKSYSFNDLVAHRLALLAMCQFAYLLTDINPEIKIVNNFSEITAHSGKNFPLLWLPFSLIDDDSEINANWDFTSDSIALWLATKLSAEKLVLVKSKKLENDPEAIQKHINNGEIDKGFQLLMKNYSGEVSFLDKNQFQLLN